MSSTPVGEKIVLAPLDSKKEVIAIWEAAKGIWKKKKPDPIQWHKKARKEWDVKLR